jgi:hypothetical protein
MNTTRYPYQHVRRVHRRVWRTNDVGANVGEETRVMRDDEAGDLGLGDEIPLEPSDGTDVCAGE